MNQTILDRKWSDIGQNWTNRCTNFALDEAGLVFLISRRHNAAWGASTPTMPLDQFKFRQALGGFCTGVTVVTTEMPDGELLGVTASSFNSVSLEPPLVLFSLDRRAYSLAKYEQAGRFAVNVLSHDQSDLCMRFAKPGGQKWDGVAYEQWETGAPILDGCVSNFDCRTHALYDGGDHLIFVGRVLRLRTTLDAEPMIFYRGGFHQLMDNG